MARLEVKDWKAVLNVLTSDCTPTPKSKSLRIACLKNLAALDKSVKKAFVVKGWMTVLIIEEIA